MDLGALDLVARTLHIASVIIWVGHNWVNVVQTPVFRGVLPADPAEAVREVFIGASKREHAIFRHASLVVWLTGAFDALTLSGSSAVIGFGAWTGSLMVLNLWLIMWPHQKKVLGFVEAPIAERLRCARITFLSSRVNTVLSIATLVLMVAGAHGGWIFR